MAEVFYSRADREALAAGRPLPETGTLTPEDYKDMLQMALDEAVAESGAKDLVSSAQVSDMNGRYAGLTSTEIGEDGRLTGKYTVQVDWGSKMDSLCTDPRDGMAYAAQRFSSAFHEVRHVEQRAMLEGAMDPDSRLDREIVTQMTVNDLYPTVYTRGYATTISEVDADVAGLEGAVAFFDRHPEIKERYGFDFRKEIMRTDEYNLIEDKHQVTDATPEEMIEAMSAYRDEVYMAEWSDNRSPITAETEGSSRSEKILIANLKIRLEEEGKDLSCLETMPNDERNCLLIDNAMDVIDNGDQKIASNLSEYRDGIVMTTRCDEYIREENEMEEAVGHLDLYSGTNAGQVVRLNRNLASYDARLRTYLNTPAPQIGTNVIQQSGRGVYLDAADEIPAAASAPSWKDFRQAGTGHADAGHSDADHAGHSCPGCAANGGTIRLTPSAPVETSRSSDGPEFG